HLAELVVARHLLERAHRDAGAPHVDQEQADAAVLRLRGLGTAEEEAPVGHLGVARPDLLPGDDEAVAVAVAARAQRAQVGAGAGLREALAPELLAGDERADEPLALRRGAVTQDRRPDQVDVRRRRRTRRAHLVELLLEEPALDDGGATAPVLAGPRD